MEEYSYNYAPSMSKKLNTEFDDCSCSTSRSSRLMHKKLKTDLQEDLQIESNKVKNDLNSTLSYLSNELNEKFNRILHCKNGNHQFNEHMHINGDNQNKLVITYVLR